MKTYIFKLVLVLLVVISCQKEIIYYEANENTTDPVIIEKTVKNGRFVFSSKEALNLSIEKLKSDDSEEIEKEFEKLYLKGFRSHTPVVSDENDQLLELLSVEYKSKPSTSYALKAATEEGIDGDGFIHDPYLASYVNNNDEIVINDTLYKFTEDKGLFFAHIKDSTLLMDYMDEINKTNPISPSNTNSLKKAIAYNPRIAEPCMQRVLYGGYSRVSSRISRYVRPILDDDCFIYPINPPTPPPPAISEEERLNNIINNLNVCDGRPIRGNWFQNIFGKSYACRDYFDRKRRIKTEFWDQNWGFYKSVGILTKTQRRRFGIWWASKSDEIHLGINHIKLRYNFPQPEINSFSHPELFPKNSYQNPIYMWDGKFEVKTTKILGKTFAKAQLDLPSGKLPFLDFGNRRLLNIYIPKLYKKGKYNLNLTTQDLTSQGNIKALYKMGIDFLKTTTSSGKTKEFAVIYQKDYKNIEVVYFANRISKRNENKIKHKFYSSANFKVGYAWNDAPKPILTPEGKQIGTDYSGTGKFKVKPADDYFRNYNYYKLDFYGMARRGNTWKGNRLIREDKK